MRKKRTFAPVNPIDRSHIVEDDSRKGLQARVRGERGVFTIIRDAMNVKTETEWVELWSPEHQFRGVRPERVKVIRKRFSGGAGN